jgi:hypothetical protein
MGETNVEINLSNIRGILSKLTRHTPDKEHSKMLVKFAKTCDVSYFEMIISSGIQYFGIVLKLWTKYQILETEITEFIYAIINKLNIIKIPYLSSLFNKFEK